MKKNNKFDILFESIMNNISDKELYGSDVYNTILKIYKFNKSTNTFDNLLTEIDNFKYLVPNVTRTEIIDDLTLELSDVDPNFDICKIEIYDKESNDLLFDCITFYGTDSNDIIDLLSYTENPRGTFEGSPEFNEIHEDSDEFDNSFKTDNTLYKGFKINIDSFDDQGDIVFMWAVNTNGHTYDDEKYYNSVETAITAAQNTIDELLRNR